MRSPFVFLLNIAAAGAAVTALIVFWRREVKRRWVDDIQALQPGSVDDAQATSEADCSFSGTNEVPAIFLSHSGKQKSFVENLYNALQNANHTPFFDKHTLPKGSPFPANIKEAALRCKLAVVVLSHDFLTSSWPMRELEMLVLERGAGAKVLPLFYKLSPQELKSPENLIKWQRKWKKIAAQHPHNWEGAVKLLKSFNGEVFTPETSEDEYIKRVVRCICKLVPSPILYDLSQVQGHQRLAEEVAGHFKKACMVGPHGARMVGLHGVGGLGKTTMCKIMVNFYNSEYPGRSHLIEFPSDGSDKKTIVQECKKALRKLVNLSNEHLLNEADSFDQVVKLIRENLWKYDVFLAIDNIWESSLEEAKGILNVRFSTNSKILFTSRSKSNLIYLLPKTLPKTSVCPLPAPEHEEAFQIFQEAFELDDLNSLLTRNQLDSVLKTCFFNGKYHALALKSLGQRAKRDCAPDKGSENIRHSLSHTLKEISCKDLPKFKDVIGLNYDNLPQPNKHMFLDITVLLMQDGDYLTHARAQQWLSFLYKECSTSIIHDLAYDGLIELENIDGGAEKIIKVHDLYLDLAQREVKTSSRFFIDGLTQSVEKIEWESLERVFLHGRHHNHNHPRFIEKLQQQECRKLQVLCATDIDFLRSGISLDLMPSLCALKLENVTLDSIKNWSSLINLESLSIGRLNSKTLSVLNLNALVRLQQLSIKSSDVRIEGLNGCVHLHTLTASACLINIGSGILKELANLHTLHLYGYYKRRSILKLDVGCLPSDLKCLEVEACEALEEIGDLSALQSLKTLVVKDCPSLKKLGGLLSILPHLQILMLVRCKSLGKCTIPDVSLVSSIPDVHIVACGELTSSGDYFILWLRCKIDQYYGYSKLK